MIVCDFLYVDELQNYKRIKTKAMFPMLINSKILNLNLLKIHKRQLVFNCLLRFLFPFSINLINFNYIKCFPSQLFYNKVIMILNNQYLICTDDKTCYLGARVPLSTCIISRNKIFLLVQQIFRYVLYVLKLKKYTGIYLT